MKLEKIKEDKKNFKINFLIKGSDEVFANTIRRLIVEEVPTLAAEDLEIKDNSSALYDEMLGLRLGLAPIKTDLNSYNLKSKCKCEGEGCAQCELKINLKAAKKGYVYTGDAQSTDPKCNFVYEKMPIVKLLAKQKLDVVITAVLGRGKEHAKWSPGWAFYKNEPVVKLGKVENPENIAKKSTDGVFTMKSGKLTLDNEKIYNSNLLESYAEMDKGISVEYTNNIIFYLECWGQIPCKTVLTTAAEILVEKTEELMGLI
jgi:DNA-directed RNA polymerase subunit D